MTENIILKILEFKLKKLHDFIIFLYFSICIYAYLYIYIYMRDPLYRSTAIAPI